MSSSRLTSNLFRTLLLATLTLLLSACGGDGVRARVFPPTVSVQELQVLPNGTWALKLRVQNFSNVSMQIDRIDAQLRLTGKAKAGPVVLTPNVRVPPESAEVIDFQMSPASAAAQHAMRATSREGGGFGYTIEGSIVSSEPDKRTDEFTFESRLSKVPGRDRILR